MNEPKTILHELFKDKKTISMLGHLMVMKGFEFTMEELSKIHDITPIETNSVLDHLIVFGMAKYRHGKYSYEETNDHAPHFEKFFKHLLLWNLERVSKK